MDRPSFIKNAKDLVTDQSFSYPGDSETFGTGAALGTLLGLKSVAINYEVLQPGDRSSWPHAHSEEEEFIFIIEGIPEVWINGDIYKLAPGDCVGLPGGTNYAHTLLNNSESIVVALVVGQKNIITDKIFYPKHDHRNDQMKKEGQFWQDKPAQKLGFHDGQTDLKRKVDKTSRKN